jgi:hypothetical protein
MCSLQSVHGRWAWKAIDDRLQGPCYLSRFDRDRKIRIRKQKTNIRKYSFVNRTIHLWNQVATDASGSLSCKSNNFRKTVRDVINKAK